MFFFFNLDFRILRGVDARGVLLSFFDFMQTATKKFILTINQSVTNFFCLSESKLFSNKVLTNMSEITNEESYISGFNNLYLRQR